MRGKRRFVATVGLPGSGKSTWAKEQILAAPSVEAVRVNLDLMREMLHADRFTQEAEKLTQKVRDRLICSLMYETVPLIISDDTNLNSETIERLQQLCVDFTYSFEIKDFTHVPLEVCIQQDLWREHPVGEAVIRDMHARYLARV